MANWYYYDDNGQKQGPITAAQIYTLLTNGDIFYDTIVESEDGKLKEAMEKIGEFSFLFENPSDSTYAGRSTREIPDIGFSHFVTPVIVTITWWISIITTICSCLFCMFLIASSPMPDVGKSFGVLFVIATAIYSLLLTRLILEFFTIQFRIERHLRTVKKDLRALRQEDEKTSKPQS